MNNSMPLAGSASFLHPFSQERSLAASLIQLKKLGYSLGQKIYVRLLQLKRKPKRTSIDGYLVLTQRENQQESISRTYALIKTSKKRSLVAVVVAGQKLLTTTGMLRNIVYKDKRYKIQKQWPQRWSPDPGSLEVGIAETERLDLTTDNWQNLGAQMEVAQ